MRDSAIRFYGYAKCSTCRKAKAHLRKQGRVLNEIDITATPPSKTLLRAILASGRYRLPQLLNRSGELYRSLHMKQKLEALPTEAIVSLLATQGRLVKRPIATDGKRFTVGFDVEEFERIWS